MTALGGSVRVEALDLNPLHWLGDAASAAMGDVWTAAMTGLWSAAVWLLKFAFGLIDAFTTPDLSPHGPMGAVLPTTLWIGATLAAVMMFVQLAVALLRRDGRSIGRLLIGVGQFGLIWVAYLGVAAGLVAAASGLEHALLRAMLGANSFSGVHLAATLPDKVGDITLATVLGVLGLLIVIPAAFFYILIMFVREAALIILVATAPISAAGLVSETGKAWFWKTLRWFFACLLISPMAALLLGIGVKLSTGVITPPTAPASGGHKAAAEFANQTAAAHAGMAVVGCIVIAIGACCPLILFRLLAFVEPGTASGAALRASWSDAGGMAGVIGGGRAPAGGSTATQTGNDGRSGGESGAESQAQSRLSGALGAFGTGVRVATSVAQRAADLGSDVLGQAGVGAPGYSLTPTDARYSRPAASGGGSSRGASGPDDGSNGDGGGGAGPEPPDAPSPPTPPTPSPGPRSPGGGGPPSAGGGGAATAGGEAGEAAGAAGVVAL